MQKFTQHQGIVVPLDLANIDTDQIIPKQYLTSIKRSGFGVNLFDSWRYQQQENESAKGGDRAVNHDFVLNFPRYKNASILLSRDNFGCGSSREHAVWALSDYGIKVLIAPSFADIFAANCLNNGLLAITLGSDQVTSLFGYAQQERTLELAVDLSRQTINDVENRFAFEFSIDSFDKKKLLEGWDDIGVTMQYQQQIKEFEQQHQKRYPWLFNDLRK